MIPIGIVTQNRVAYLDITLRSLSASDIPANTKVTIFDDASSDPFAEAYYTTNDQIQLELSWPTGPKWKKLGLDVITRPVRIPTGIKDLVRVTRMADKPLGVVRGSCFAIQQLFVDNPGAPGVILLQDDVLLKPEWLKRIVTTAENSSQFTNMKLGLLAGIKLNHRLRPIPKQPAIRSGITAQCLYITRAAYDALKNTYLARQHKITRRFDDTFRNAVATQKLWAGCIFPYVCQHIGVVSRVRPKWKWNSRPSGRVGYYSHPPYALSDKVRAFR